ncbi:TATA box-binding protein-associated factor RNA polymerase I subunit A [Clarias gariepinus]
MDDFLLELNVPAAEQNDEISDEDRSESTLKQSRLLHVDPARGQHKETGFHKSTRLCLRAIRDAILHHRWEEAVQYLKVYTQTLEDTTASKQLAACEIFWRLGTEVLKHHPNKQMEQFNILYERMKNTGVKNYAKICLEHMFHLLLNGPIHNAKQQLSIAMNWRYGKQSEHQSLELKLIHAYCGFLDYLVWSTKRTSISDADDCVSEHEMHSYFRQASVTLQEIVKQPGVWDPFICGCIDMLEFYNDKEEALQLLLNYAYSQNYPSNPNAHVYLYKFQKRNKASPAQLISTLKVLHSLVPSHELMLEYCTLLITSGEQKNLQRALSVLMNLLEYASWKTDMKAWNCLLQLLQRLKNKKLKNLIKAEWEERKDLWMKMHYKPVHSRRESMELTNVKIQVMHFFGVYNRHYNRVYYQEKKRKKNDSEKGRT